MGVKSGSAEDTLNNCLIPRVRFYHGTVVRAFRPLCVASHIPYDLSYRIDYVSITCRLDFPRAVQF